MPPGVLIDGPLERLGVIRHAVTLRAVLLAHIHEATGRRHHGGEDVATKERKERKEAER